MAGMKTKTVLITLPSSHPLICLDVVYNEKEIKAHLLF